MSRPTESERMDALENSLRDLLVITTAQEFVIEILLANFMGGLNDADRTGFVADVIRVGSRTDHLRAADDTEAEALSDIAVRSSERIAWLLEKARSRID